MDQFLYDRDLRHEKVKLRIQLEYQTSKTDLIAKSSYTLYRLHRFIWENNWLTGKKCRKILLTCKLLLFPAFINPKILFLKKTLFFPTALLSWRYDSLQRSLNKCVDFSVECVVQISKVHSDSIFQGNSSKGSLQRLALYNL